MTAHADQITRERPGYKFESRELHHLHPPRQDRIGRGPRPRRGEGKSSMNEAVMRDVTTKVAVVFGSLVNVSADDLKEVRRLSRQTSVQST